MSDQPSNFVSGAELARRLGVDEKMVRKYEANGLFRRLQSGPNAGSYDAEKCRALYEANRDPDRIVAGIAGAEAVGAEKAAPRENALTRARAAQAIIGAQRQKLEFERLQGQLISKADARTACLAVATLITERIDGAAAQIGPRVVGLDAIGAERVAREILTAIRREIAGLAEAIEGVGNA